MNRPILFVFFSEALRFARNESERKAIVTLAAHGLNNSGADL